MEMMQFNSCLFQLEECRITINKEEEIKKLTIDDNLNEVQRSYFILTKAQARQKQAIYANLHNILQEPNAVQVLLPIIRIELLTQSEPIQILAARSLVKFPLLGSLDLMKLTLDLLHTYSQPVVQEWILILEAIYPSSKPDLEKTIIALTDHGQPEVGRWVGTKMIAIVTQYQKDNIKGRILDRLRLLCQDSDVELRQLIAQEVLQTVILNISQTLLEMYLIDKLLELMYDSDLQVKCAAIKTFFKVQTNFPQEQRNPRVLKLVIDFMQSSNQEVQNTMASISGPLLYDISDLLTEEFTELFLSLYSKTSSYWFLYNLPGILNLLQSKPLIEQYCRLLSEQTELRQCLSVFPQVIKHMDFLSIQKEICPLLPGIFESSEAGLVIPSIGSLIQSFMPENNLDSEIESATQEHISDILKLVSKYFQSLSYRELPLFLEQLEEQWKQIVNGQVLALLQLRRVREGDASEFVAAGEGGDIRESEGDDAGGGEVLLRLQEQVQAEGRGGAEGGAVLQLEQLQEARELRVVGGADDALREQEEVQGARVVEYFKVLELGSDRVFSVQLQLVHELPNIRRMVEDNDGVVKLKLVLRQLKKKGSKSILDALAWAKQKLKQFELGNDRNSGLELEEFEEQLAREKDKEQEEEKKETEINFTNEKYVMNFLNKYRRRHTIVGSKMNPKKQYILHRSSILDESTSKKVQEIRGTVEKSRHYTDLLRNERLVKNPDASPIKIVKRQYSLKRGKK